VRGKASRTDPHADRLSRFRTRLVDEGLDGMIVGSDRDIRYLTGYHGEDCIALVTPDDLHLVTDFRYAEDLEPFADRARLVIRTDGMSVTLGDMIERERLDRVGIQAEHVTVEERRLLAKHVGAKRLRNMTGVLSDLRKIKDRYEVRTIRRAIEIQEDALRATFEEFRSGETEAEFAARLEYEARRRGAEGLAFSPCVAAKSNGSRPHYRPSSKVKITQRQPLLIDWGARVDGYVSDLTRTFGVGSMPRRIRDIYEIVLEAQRRAIDAIGPGAGLAEVDAVARDYITDCGYGDRFGHGLGHGLGLDVHEAPSLSWRSTSGTLEPGMVVTVEPGIYLPGTGGVRIEDDVLVTATGREVLSNYPKDLESAVLAV